MHKKFFFTLSWGCSRAVIRTHPHKKQEAETGYTPFTNTPASNAGGGTCGNTMAACRYLAPISPEKSARSGDSRSR